jgi:hypothetical protein
VPHNRSLEPSGSTRSVVHSRTRRAGRISLLAFLVLSGGLKTVTVLNSESLDPHRTRSRCDFADPIRGFPPRHADKLHPASPTEPRDASLDASAGVAAGPGR